MLEKAVEYLKNFCRAKEYSPNRRRLLIYSAITVAALQFLNPLSDIVYARETPLEKRIEGSYKRKHYTIAHEYLDIERELGTVRDYHYQILDDIIDEAKRTIQVKSTYTKEEALSVLQTISDILVNRNFIVSREDVQLPSHALTPKRLDNEIIQCYEKISLLKTKRYEIDSLSCSNVAKKFIDEHYDVKNHMLKKINEEFHNCDCDTLSFIYLGIAEAIGLPISAFVAKDHIALRFHLMRDKYVNWDPVQLNEKKDDYYIMYLGTPIDAVKRGVFLRSLSRVETLAIQYTNVADVWVNRGDARRAIKSYSTAIKLNPRYYNAYNNRALAYMRLGRFDDAINDLNTAKNLDPENVRYYYNSAMAYEGKKDYKNARENLDIVMKKDKSNSADNYFFRARLYYKEGKLEKALEDINYILRLDDKNAFYHNLKGLIYNKESDYTKAGIEFENAIELDPNNRSYFYNILKNVFSESALRVIFAFTGLYSLSMFEKKIRKKGMKSTDIPMFLSNIISKKKSGGI